MSVAQLTIPSSYTGTTVKWEVTSNLPSDNFWTAMCWALLTSPGDTYRDLISNSDNNNVAGLGAKLLSGSNYNLLLGDLNTDNIGNRLITTNEWHHYAMTIRPTPSGTECFGWLDGHQEVGPVSLIAPTPATSFRLWNGRASATDSGSQWVGVATAFKIWNNIAFNGDQIRREMYSFLPQRTKDLYSAIPVFDVGSKNQVFNGVQSAWTFTGTVTESNLYPPGVSWNAPYSKRRYNQQTIGYLNRRTLSDRGGSRGIN